MPHANRNNLLCAAAGVCSACFTPGTNKHARTKTPSYIFARQNTTRRFSFFVLRLLHGALQVRALQPHPDAAVPRAVSQRRERAAGSANRFGKDRRGRDRNHADAERAPRGKGNVGTEDKTLLRGPARRGNYESMPVYDSSTIYVVFGGDTGSWIYAA